MPKQKLQTKKLYKAPSAVIFLGCSLIVVVGIYIVHALGGNRYAGTVGAAIGQEFQLYLLDVLILVVAIAAARKLSKKAKVPITHNKDSTFKHVSTLYVGILGLGILIGLVTWVQSGKSAIRPLFAPIMISSAAQIVIYLIASDIVFSSTEPVRKKVWAPIIAILLFIIPSAVFYAFSR